MGSPFDVLQVDPEADEEEVDRAYRRRVLDTHPDRGGSADEFKRVTAAYEAIKSGDPSDWVDAPDDGRARAPDVGRTRSPTPGAGADGDGVGPVGWERQTSSRVEYVNYDVLEDFGWALDDDDLFEKASEAGLDPADHGRILVRPHESLLEAAEGRGFAWPYACRGGACANCAVAVREGELAMPANHILPEEMLERGIRLSCNGMPTTEEMRIVINLKHRPDLEELRLPPHRFERDHPNV